MTQNRKTVVGAVEFTAQGVVITKTYNTPDELQLERVPFDSEKFMSYLQARIDHCAKSLNENIMHATYISEEVVLWDGGRFSRRVYDMMKDFVSTYKGFHPNFERLAKDSQFKGCCQQVIRHLYDNKIEDRDMFYVLTEYITCAQSILDSDLIVVVEILMMSLIMKIMMIMIEKRNCKEWGTTTPLFPQLTICHVKMSCQIII